MHEFKSEIIDTLVLGAVNCKDQEYENIILRGCCSMSEEIIICSISIC